MPIVIRAGDRAAAAGFARALAVSLVIHGLLLWPSMPQRQEAVAAPPLHAVLRPVAAPRPVAPSPMAGALPERASAVSRGSSAPAPVRAAEAPPAPPPAAITTSFSTENAEAGSVAGPAPGEARTMPVASSLPPEDGVDPEALRGYRLALAREARRFRVYPREAVRAGWEGTVEVQVKFPGGAMPPAVTLAKSSGHALLDEAALTMLGAALPLAPVPEALRGGEFALSLPVVFELPR